MSDGPRGTVTFDVTKELADELHDASLPLVVASPCHDTTHGLTHLAIILTGAQSQSEDGTICQEGLANALSALTATVLTSMGPVEFHVWLTSLVATMAMAYVQETGEDIPDDMKHLLATAMVARVGQTLRPAMGEVLSILTSLTGETELQTTFVDLLEEMQKEGAARKAKLN